MGDAPEFAPGDRVALDVDSASGQVTITGVVVEVKNMMEPFWPIATVECTRNGRTVCLTRNVGSLKKIIPAEGGEA